MKLLMNCLLSFAFGALWGMCVGAVIDPANPLAWVLVIFGAAAIAFKIAPAITDALYGI